MIYGATQVDWTHCDLILGLSDDLLPVVSNPHRKISAKSNMKALGKAPSRLNALGTVVGIVGWTTKTTSSDEIDAWAKQPDYGICVQTRTIKAIDIDIDDTEVVKDVLNVIEKTLDVRLPKRGRSNSAKCLLVLNIPDKLGKRTIKTPHGLIEFLGHGQQFVAVGTHTSGTRYDWDGGLPDVIPDVSLDQFEALWAALQAAFGIEPDSKSKTTERTAILAESVSDDPISNALYDSGSVLALGTDGKMSIICPWEDEHSADTGLGATVYFPPHTGGYRQGNFKCLHAHCEGRTVHDLKSALDIHENDFEDISEETIDLRKKRKFPHISMYKFKEILPTQWLIKNVIPKASLGMMYGASTAGKSFAMLDIAGAIARGVDWRGNASVRGRVVYVCAEGQTGFRKRCAAYIEHNKLEEKDIDLDIIPFSPNLLNKNDVLELRATLSDVTGPIAVVVLDTLATVMCGGDENSATDTGKVLAVCRGLTTAFGTLILLVHHVGKDVSKGARGWSGVRAAVDVEIEVTKVGDDRMMRITKQKDGEEGRQFGFKLASVAVGEDEDGDPITSCVVEHIDTSLEEMRAKNKPLKINEQAVMDAIQTIVGLTAEIADTDTVVAHAMTLRGGGSASMRSNVKRSISAMLKGGKIREVVGKNGSIGLEIVTV